MAALGIGACAVYDEQHFVTGTRLDAPSTAAPEPSDAGMAMAPLPQQPDEAVMVEVVPACVSETAVNPCEALPHLPAAPVIDGVMECGLTRHALAQLEAAQSTVTYAAAWSDAGFYVYIEVQGPASPARNALEPLYCGDAVELFVDSDGQPGTDGSYNAPGTMQFVVAAPSGADMNTGRFLAGTAQGPWISPNLHVTKLENGYAVEALIVGADLGLWSWKPSGQLGFNLAVNLSGAGAPRGAPCTTGVGQSVLRVAEPRIDCDGKPWCDTRSFCVPALGPL